MDHATHEDAGLNTHLRQPILRMLHNMGEDWTVLTVDDVDMALRRGLESGDYTLRVAGKEADIQPAVDKARARYAEWVANYICDGVFNGFRGIKSVILVGGGSLLVQDHLRSWYAEKVLDPATHPTTRKIHPVDFNAVGGLRFALMRLKQE